MTTEFSTNFAALDWVIVAVYLSGSVAIGVVMNRYIHDVTHYMVGGRGSGTALNVATYIGTGLGLVTLMYASIDALAHGFAYVTLALIGAVVGAFLGGTGFVIRQLRSLDLLTIPEYFERRFSRRTRVVGGIICALAGILNMGLFPKMGATFITYVTDLGAGSDDQAQMVNMVTSLLIILVLIYTVLGGMVSVIVTDYIQFVVLSIGMGLGVYFCLTHQDMGWSNITAAMAEHRGERMFNPVAANSYGWLWIGFNFLVFLAAGICWAPEATRALTARSEQATRRTFLFAAPGQFIRLGIPALWAVSAFCLIASNSELTAHFFPDGLNSAPDKHHAGQAMPMAMGYIVPTGLLGVLVAGLLAAFMSTHDSYFLCWASVITRDIVGPLSGKQLTDRQQITITRIGIVCIGLFLLCWGIWYDMPSSVWQYMAVTGTIYLSGASVALVGGIYWRRASSAGALAALLGGLAAVTLLLNEQLGWGWDTIRLGLLTYAFCAVLFVVFSWLFPDRQPAATEEPS